MLISEMKIILYKPPGSLLKGYDMSGILRPAFELASSYLFSGEIMNLRHNDYFFFNEWVVDDVWFRTITSLNLYNEVIAPELFIGKEVSIKSGKKEIGKSIVLDYEYVELDWEKNE